MKSYQIVSTNIEKFYKITGLNSARLCAVAKEKGITLSTSTLSRFLNGGNTTIETLDSLVQVINWVPDFGWLTQSHLLQPGVFEQSKKATVNSAICLNDQFSNLFIELNEIGWIKPNQKINMETIVEFSIHTLKKSGLKFDSIIR